VSMRALVFENSLSFQPRHADPRREEGDCLIKVRQAGVCATDLEITKGYRGFTGVLGHEFVGEVVESPVDRKWMGKRVVGEINVVCGRCDLCLSGLSSHCRNRTVLGIQKRDGAFADFVRLPALNLHEVPAGVEDDAAVFVEPLAAAFQVLKQVKLDGKKWVTVIGDGRLGLLCAQVLRNAGCPVRLIGKHAEKMRLCDQWGIRNRPLKEITPRHDQDVVVDCTGSAAGLELAMQLVRPRGTIVLKSTAAEGKALNLAPLVIDEINVVGSRCGPFKEALKALTEKTVDVTSMIHKRVKLEHGVEAMELAGKPGVLKVLLTME
jgi:threonine dehydrogenase-like Zn-dependent dehydrogenase